MSHGTETRRRTAHLTIRFSPEERAFIDDAARIAGLTSGSYARRVLLGGPAPREVRRKPADHRELVRILGQLGHLGGNLNQLAKAANQNTIVYGNEIEAALREVKGARDAIMAALGHEP